VVNCLLEIFGLLLNLMSVAVAIIITLIAPIILLILNFLRIFLWNYLMMHQMTLTFRTSIHFWPMFKLLVSLDQSVLTLESRIINRV